MKVL
ncbi:transposon Ty3-G Gag-Pol polyprotein, partial [Nephila pilipes]|jgi:hypothetical protein